MNTKTLLIAILAGVASAVFSAAPQGLAGFGVVLSIFAPLPIFVASLGWGSIAGIVAAGVAVAATLITGDPSNALSVALSGAIPAAWLGHMAGLWRQDDDGNSLWFPLSTILSRLALYCGAAVIVGGMISGFDPDAIKQALIKFMSGVAQQNASGKAVDLKAVRSLAEFYAYVVPILVPMTLMFLLIFNMNLGARITRTAKLLQRPKDDIPASLSLPVTTLGIFAAAILVSMLGGGIGLAGQAMSGAIGFALSLVGLATMHYLTRGNAARGLILWASYIAIIFSVLPLAMFTILGLAEVLLQLRARKPAPTQPPHS